VCDIYEPLNSWINFSLPDAIVMFTSDPCFIRMTTHSRLMFKIHGLPPFLPFLFSSALS
jgi:hypothetical protein